MATRSYPRTPLLDAESIVTVLAGLLSDDRDTDQLVIGVEPHDAAVDLHIAPLPDDDRAGSAGLFGMRAEPSWCAVAAVLSGSARHLDDHSLVGRGEAVVVVDRCGGIASVLHLDGEPVAAPACDDPGPPCGLTLDALHRMLDLPSPGDAPPAAIASLAVWSQALVAHTLKYGATSWSEAVELHPGTPSGRRRCSVDASVETVVEATLRAEGELSWERLHRRACTGSPPPDLSAEEVAWMDPILYGRWVVGSLPDAELAAEVLHAHGELRTADAVLAVADAVLERVGPVNLG